MEVLHAGQTSFDTSADLRAGLVVDETGNRY